MLLPRASGTTPDALVRSCRSPRRQHLVASAVVVTRHSASCIWPRSNILPRLSLPADQSASAFNGFVSRRTLLSNHFSYCKRALALGEAWFRWRKLQEDTS